MNIKRGLFRIWVLLSVVWALFIVADNWSSITNPYLLKAYHIYEVDTRTYPELTPSRNAELGTKLFTDYTLISFPHEVELYIPDELETARRDRVFAVFMSSVVEKRDSDINAARWARIWRVLKEIAIPVFAAFLLGSALFWAVAGFKARQA